jgi:hypothetical protein
MIKNILVRKISIRRCSLYLFITFWFFDALYKSILKYPSFKEQDSIYTYHSTFVSIHVICD